MNDKTRSWRGGHNKKKLTRDFLYDKDDDGNSNVGE